MKKAAAIILVVNIFLGWTKKNAKSNNDFIVAEGQMPSAANDKQNNLHVVFGKGDSIMYTYSTDRGNTFSTPVLIKEIPHVYTYSMRGPQIAVTDKGVLITACTTKGNIYSFYKKNGGTWKQGNVVNDVNNIAKEGLMALSVYGNNAFMVWLDVRGSKQNKVYGAKSVDGGKTWSKNIPLYASPDSSVCECCKPSVVVWKNKIAVMFRNQLNGNRDLYLVQSNDGGKSFGTAEKLGTGSWKLNACPMDGGSISVNNKGEWQTVWRRESKIYLDMPGETEQEIGEGRSCIVETVNNTNVYAWLENGKVTVLKPANKKIIPGEGTQPVLKTIDNNHVVCLWESNKQIHASIITL